MAYGVDAPFGLQPRSYLNGNVWTGQVTEYFINGNISGGATSYATSLYMGDLVKLDVQGVVVKAAVGDASIGVFWGCKYFDTTNTLVFSKNWTASTPTFNNTNPICYVVDDPNVLFSAQVKGTGNVTGNINTINIGVNANATYQSELNYNYNIHFGASTGGSTISGNSTSYVDLATQNTTATLQVKLIQLEKYPGNNFGTVFNNGLFLINNHIYKGGTGTAGV
jgi:hypothetical protein